MNKFRLFRFLASVSLLSVLVLASAISASAETPPSGFGLTLGYEAIDLAGGHSTFSHDTHPSDSFLPRAGVPGSAGMTSLDEWGVLHFASVGVRYQAPPFLKSMAWDFNLGALGGNNERRDEHKNDNDPRPDTNAAFVYSKSEVNWGFYTSLGLTYHLEHFYFGAATQLAGVRTRIDKGWDRWGEDESIEAESKFPVFFSLGPKIGYRFERVLSVEGTVLFGRSTTYGLQFVFRFD